MPRKKTRMSSPPDLRPSRTGTASPRGATAPTRRTLARSPRGRANPFSRNRESPGTTVPGLVAVLQAGGGEVTRQLADLAVDAGDDVLGLVLVLGQGADDLVDP